MKGGQSSSPVMKRGLQGLAAATPNSGNRAESGRGYGLPSAATPKTEPGNSGKFTSKTME